MEFPSTRMRKESAQTGTAGNNALNLNVLSYQVEGESGVHEQ